VTRKISVRVESRKCRFCSNLAEKYVLAYDLEGSELCGFPMCSDCFDILDSGDPRGFRFESVEVG
jgi:hypothetical protein